MRRITDSAGQVWDVQVGRESYGMHVALFMPADGGDIRQTMLGVDTWLEAEQVIESLGDDELRAYLQRARPWGDAAGPGF